MANDKPSPVTDTKEQAKKHSEKVRETCDKITKATGIQIKDCSRMVGCSEWGEWEIVKPSWK